MASTSRSSTSTNPSTSASTSDGSFLRYEPPKTKLAFKRDKGYHVFLSFRGPDVRKTLVDHLFEALSVAGLNVFLDSEKLEKGEIIGLSLERAIESSAIRIPIFSKGYAQSTWCLREAAEMVRTPGLIIPLFYDVDPTHVRYPEKENSPYCQSFQKYRRHSDRHSREEIEWWKHAIRKICPCLQLYGHSVRHTSEKIEQWKNALFQICKRSGWSMDIADGEARMIKRVVNDLIKTLDRVPLEVAKHPVGLEHVKNVLIQKLNLNVMDDVTKVGIWGIGGIGKTTIAKAVYNQVSADFEAASFVSNVRAAATEVRGLEKLQKKILKDLAKYNEEVDSVDDGITLFKDRLGGKRVLLVLDDVDDAIRQLDALVGDWFASASRIIITSRDKHILNVAGVSNQCIHEMSGLEIKESLQLFSWRAFLRAFPSHDYEDLSRGIVKACKGHPLSLEVIGSMLYDKKDDKDCWKEALHNITDNSEIYKILYISYNALSDEEKEIFVDIACFFIGEDKTLPIVFWESLYTKAHTAVSNLSLKLLIKIDDEGLFQMHDHLRDMGQTIAEKEKKGTRKWKPTDLSTVCNSLSRRRLIGGNPQSLEMLYTDGLHYLHLKNLTIECMTRDALFRLPLSLKWLRLENCAFEIGKNVTFKKPRHSRIVDNIWQCKVLQLNGCFNLDSLPNSLAISLSLSLSPPITPISLPMFVPETIGNLSQLQSLDLGWCDSLNNLPNSIGNLSQLQHLDLNWCKSLSSLPNSIGNLSQLQSLELGGCESLSGLPDSIGNMSQLQSLKLGGCESLSNLPYSIGNLSQLQHLDLSCCESLRSLPDSIGNLSQLQSLELGECASLSGLPGSIGNLSQLQSLKLGGCGSLSNLPDSIGNLSQLQSLELGGCESLSSLPDSIVNLSQLQRLDLGVYEEWAGCESLSSLPDNIGNLSQLQSLNLEYCWQLNSLPDSIGNLSQLQSLDLGQCGSLSNLPGSIGNLSQLQSLSLEFCMSLSSLPDSIGNLSQLQRLYLKHFKSSLPHSIGNLSQLQHLDLSCCRSLSNLPNSIGNLSQLQHLDLACCESLSSLPDSIGNLSQLQSLDLRWCRSLSSLPESIGSLSKLHSLELEGCESLRPSQRSS